MAIAINQHHFQIVIQTQIQLAQLLPHRQHFKIVEIKNLIIYLLDTTAYQVRRINVHLNLTFETILHIIKGYSNSINNFNICDKTLTDLTDTNGFLSSPKFPSYTNVSSECTQRIVAPINKVIKIWLFVDILSR